MFYLQYDEMQHCNNLLALIQYKEYFSSLK